MSFIPRRPARLRPLSLSLSLALGAAFGASVLAGPGHAAEGLHVMKTASCGCCHAWAERMAEAGYAVETTNLSYGELVKQKIKAGLSEELASCHTAMIDGYVVEGHVPAADIARLLEEKPEAIGLSVPGMPMGSPGMDFGDDSEPYDVLLVKADGTTEIFSSH